MKNSDKQLIKAFIALKIRRDLEFNRTIKQVNKEIKRILIESKTN
jgi:hypothetical protein